MSIIDCNNPPHIINTKHCTHEMISTQQTCLNEAYIMSPCNTKINDFINYASLTVDQEDPENHNNEIHNNPGGLEHVSVESMVEIITKRELDFYCICNDIENINSSTTDYTSSCEVGMLP